MKMPKTGNRLRSLGETGGFVVMVTSLLCLTINLLLLGLQLFAGIAIIAISLSRETFLEISKRIMPPGEPLLGSAMLDQFMQKKTALIVILFLLGTLLKELIIKELSVRLWLNVILLAGLIGLFLYLTVMIYAPATP